MSSAPTPVNAKLLIVEDDDRIRASLRLALREEGYAVEVAADAAEALSRFSAEEPDLVLLDVLLPGMDGLEFCRTIRRTSAVPVVMLTARDDSHDVVAGLEAGADDYVTKPYNVKEVAARIRALLRRTQGLLPAAGAARRFGRLEVRVDEGAVAVDGEPVELTRTEFRLLSELIQHERKVLSRDQLLELVWGYDYYGDVRVVDAHVRRLRAKIERDPSEPEFVTTVRGLGYKFDPQPAG
ncbi:response regulator [Actinospongicola halichondriae]|uniref:response regulator n=1 Tax=Actinospongicola halichondriae TaxID=3236844 RepID=UPI003D51FA42